MDTSPKGEQFGMEINAFHLAETTLKEKNLLPDGANSFL